MGQRTALVIHRAVRADQTEASDRDLLRRFAADRDQAAFALLVRRHAPMVLGVCRRALHNAQDAEDACQATFLVLARKAGAGRWQASIANWLYAAARKVAGNARVAADRRARREGRAAVPEAVPPLDQMTGRDLLAVLDEELDRLPPRYREPLVLCYLQGLTRDEAAGRLGIPPTTLKSQLDRGRKRLADALTRRGVAFGAGLLACVTTSRVGAVPARVLNAVLAAVRGNSSKAVADLSRGVVMNGLVKKSALVLLASLGVMALGVGLGSAPPTSAGPPPAKVILPKPVDTKPVAASPTDSNDIITYRGRILGPDGKPVAGAALYLTDTGGYYRRPSPVPERGISGPDGRFEFSVPKAKFDDPWGAVVVAAARRYGPGWVDVRPGARRHELAIRLADDDVPITGRIVDLEGKPIPNVTLTVWQIHAAPGEDLGPWVEAARAKIGEVLDLERKYLPRYTTALTPKATTGADGRFRLTGIGRNRLVRGIIDGPTIASQHVWILTRTGDPIEVVYSKGDREYGEPNRMTTYYGADFRLAAAPGQPVVGVVRDADTKKPIPGVTVRSYSQKVGPSRFRSHDPVVQTKTDANGRYRLLGMPTGKGYSIAVVPAKDLPYVPRHLDVPEGVGVAAVTVDIDLKRGVWIEGKITNKVTGKPLKASVEYFSIYSNPNRTDFPGYDGTVLMGDLWVGAKEDGTYRVVGLPGPGVVGVYYHEPPYLRSPDRADDFGAKENSLETAPYHISFTSNYNAIARVNPAKGVESVRRDITLDPGWTFAGKVLGPDGGPLGGARKLDLNGRLRWDPEPMPTAEFTAGFNPHAPHDVLFQHREKGLVGVTRPPKANGGSVTVKLEPEASVAGRLVDADGKPRAGVELDVRFRPTGWGGWHNYARERVATDRDGRFHLAGLVPGFEYELREELGSAPFGDGLRSGAVKDLGDVRTRPGTE